MSFDESGQECLVGFCKAAQFKLGQALNHGSSYFDLFDAQGSSEEIAELLLESEDEFSKDLYEKYEEELVYITGLLVIERIEILPQYRGRDYGLLALDLITSHLAFGSDCIAALKAYPLQFENAEETASLSDESKEALKNFDCSLDEGRQKLVQYYRRAGFELFRSDSVMVRPI